MRELKQEAKWLAATFAVFLIIVYIAYRDESVAVVARTAAAIYWLFVIPGYAVMFHWRDHLGFVERVVVGTVAAMVVAGVSSYYLGLIGLKLQNQTLVLPAAVILISFALAAGLSGRKKQQQQNLFDEKGLSKTQQ